ncbi:S8 family serine peptidase [Sphingomonas sp. SUN019]|uniref:S8 family serine peptidase n=1 Tax=Sphingomonas sp. SUN019 TaxID=2937788 RepID=UPI002164EED2|nr:S8 family serine peptidase [Sphingomonas sp. SUN019]UVO51301.1 S8 family serine peptidase [Sphingomonas sp. SUN019]
MEALDLVGLRNLMRRGVGSPVVKIGLIDGPVHQGHPDLADAQLRELSGPTGMICAPGSGAACLHGTFIASILCAKRGSVAPAICPGCTVLTRPIFATSPSSGNNAAAGTLLDLSLAIITCVDAGARVLNLSASFDRSSVEGENALRDALDFAVRHDVIVVAAAGNRMTLGSTALTRHLGVIPVVACDKNGLPTIESNFGNSVGRRGLRAPGEGVLGLGVEKSAIELQGTSVAVPFVVGTIALLWSEFPMATATEIRSALLGVPHARRSSVVPPLLDASAAYRRLSATFLEGRTA